MFWVCYGELFVGIWSIFRNRVDVGCMGLIGSVAGCLCFIAVYIVTVGIAIVELHVIHRKIGSVF